MNKHNKRPSRIWRKAKVACSNCGSLISNLVVVPKA
jgi:hypothetical protein